MQSLKDAEPEGRRPRRTQTPKDAEQTLKDADPEGCKMLLHAKMFFLKFVIKCLHDALKPLTY